MHRKLDQLITEMIEKGVNYRDAIREFEKRFIKKALEKNNYRINHTAEFLGLNRNTLAKKIKNNNIHVK
ncbi:MAG: histidine kinase [Candidatus Aminicenantes bacterium]|nr:histidine kinase [Candidatus Aminicenantes bacterium]MDH5714511.1 histidine kinase [Candidatus Aminicenantes bacterium]